MCKVEQPTSLYALVSVELITQSPTTLYLLFDYLPHSLTAIDTPQHLDVDTPATSNI